jgi:hypothetical protein
MDKHSNKAKIQITDLINESVSHAVARRQKAMELEGFETDLLLDTEQDCDRIQGGIIVFTPPRIPIFGYTYHPTANIQ